MTEKSCGNCIQCEKYTSNGKEHWSCENYDRTEKEAEVRAIWAWNRRANDV